MVDGGLDWLVFKRRALIQRDVSVGGDVLGHLADRQEHRAIVVIGAQVGDHGAANVADFGVGKNAFKAVAGNDLPFVVFYGQKYQDSAIGPLFADTHLVHEVSGIRSDVVSVDAVDGDDGELGVGLGVVELIAETVDSGDCFRRKDVRVVGDVVGGMGKVGSLLRGQLGGGKDDEDGQEEPGDERR